MPSRANLRHRLSILAATLSLVVVAACTPDNPDTPTSPINFATSLSNQHASALPVPEPYTYTSFNGDILPRFAWKGAKIAFLTERPDLDPQVMQRLLTVFDSVYAYYAATVGGTPIPYNLVDGRLSIAEVPSTCGAGCAYLGFTSIELLAPYWTLLYDGVAQRDEFDQVLFFEFGRNFWLQDLDAALAYKAPQDAGSIVTGYAVFMRFAAMEAVGVKGGPFNGLPYSTWLREVVRLSDRYERDHSLTLSNTLFVGRGPTNPIGAGATDLFASFILNLRRSYNPTTFVPRLWQAALSRPAAVTTQDAVDNFVVSASIAANRNLRDYSCSRSGGRFRRRRS
ncbi:MAG: hypothetical protein IPF98_22520 [Gemmatimonadetes bacterium]|nr:hypothetical protein [Gemmatimonadota bacterium]